MKYSTIQKVYSMLLLCAFTGSTTFAYPAYSTMPDSDSTVLTGDIKLSQGQEKVYLSLRDSDVKQVLRMFADKLGKNIVFHSSVEGKVTLDLVNMPVEDAFNLVLQVSGLNYYIQQNTLVVIAKDSDDNAMFSRQEMMTFPVQYVNASKIADFLNKNVFGIKKAGLSGNEPVTVNTATNEIIVFGMKSDAKIVKKVIEQLDRAPLSKTFAVNHTTPAQMADMICNMLLPAHGTSTNKNDSANNRNEGDMTGGAANLDEGNSTDTSETAQMNELKLGEGIVACTAAPTNTSKTVSAFDLQNVVVSYFPQRGTVSMMGGSANQMKLVEEFIRKNDVKQPQAYIEVSIIELNENGSKEFSNNWAIHSKAWGFEFDGTSLSGGRPGGIDGNYATRTYRHFQPGYFKDGEYQNAVYDELKYKTYEVPSNSYISWTMNYIIENRKGRVLANPKILVTNGQESIIDLTQDYVEKVTSEFLSSSQNGTGTTGTAQKTYTIGKDLGIKVTLVPFISKDGYVTLNLKPEYSTQAGQILTASPTALGEKDIAATLLSRRNLDLKNVRIKDGETLILGGMIQETELKNVQKLPILGDLPIIGTAFRSTKNEKTKSELVIMVTPKIINDGEGAVSDSL